MKREKITLVVEREFEVRIEETKHLEMIWFTDCPECEKEAFVEWGEFNGYQVTTALNRVDEKWVCLATRALLDESTVRAMRRGDASGRC